VEENGIGAPLCRRTPMKRLSSGALLAPCFSVEPKRDQATHAACRPLPAHCFASLNLAVIISICQGESRLDLLWQKFLNPSRRSWMSLRILFGSLDKALVQTFSLQSHDALNAISDKLLSGLFDHDYFSVAVKQGNECTQSPNPGFLRPVRHAGARRFPKTLSAC
jgi:hypothetical protein